MLKRAEPPICVGLYARWGGGKSFFLFLMLSIFDPKAKEHPVSKMLVQSFEEGYGKENKEEAPPQSLPAWCMQLIWDLVCNILLPTRPYWLSTLSSILFDLLTCQSTAGAPNEEEQSLLGRSSKRKRSRWCSWCSAKVAPEPGPTPNNAAELKKDYVFVRFNAWEYASSDELWTGLVRNMYAKVEMRSTQPPTEPGGSCHTDSQIRPF